MTLLELMLASVILTFILLGGMSLNVSSAKALATMGSELRLQNELTYVSREMETTLRRGNKAEVASGDDPVEGPYDEVTVEISDPLNQNAPPSVISYRYYVRSQKLVKRDAFSLEVILSQGTLGRWIQADFDQDQDVDEDDLKALQDCMGQSPIPPECADKNLDGAGIVDANDLQKFNLCQGGSDLPPLASCESIRPAFWLSSGNRMINAGFSVTRTTSDGRRVSMPAVTKTILMRV